MLYFLGTRLHLVWGPFRLFSSHLVLLALGTLLGGLVVWAGLPRLWHVLPHDRGKVLAADGGKMSKGKPTGAGLLICLLLLPVLLLVLHLDGWMFGVLACLGLTMLLGYWDDASKTPWGELRKGLTDLVVAIVMVVCMCRFQPVEIWVPFVKGTYVMPVWGYIPMAVALLWLTMNATNCSDGVDGLVGTLTLMALFSLVALLYGVVGYRPLADYLLIPHNPRGASWAILLSTAAGGLAGYLWHNAEPSSVLMGDAGSRVFGMLVGVGVLASGNPALVFVVVPMILLNGLPGLGKLALFRIMRRIGFDVTPSDKLTPEQARRQFVLIRALNKVRFPLHDHFRRIKKWSNAQVLMRFALIQAFLTPVLFVLLMKIR